MIRILQHGRDGPQLAAAICRMAHHAHALLWEHKVVTPMSRVKQLASALQAKAHCLKGLSGVLGQATLTMNPELG